MIKGRGVRRLGAVLVVAGLAGAPLSGAGAAVDPSSNYKILARADAFAVEYLNTAAPVFAEEPVIYGTPATAQSLVDSVGQSTAFASAPYPGDIMVGLPDNGKGVVAGFGGPPEIVPTYPFYVQSEHPIRPHAVQDQSGNRLVADSSQYTSSSDARSGLITGDLLAALQAQASSRAVIDSETGKMTATADSRLDALKLTETLQIGKSSSHAQVVQEPGQPAVKESSFTIGSIIVGGVEFGFTDEGFKAGDQSPGSGDPSPLFDALKGAGISIEVLPATGTESSIESAGMRITQVQEFGGQTQRISIILGRVRASIEGSAQTASGDGLLEPFPANDTFLADPVPADPVRTPSIAEGMTLEAEPVPEELVDTSGFLADFAGPVAFDAPAVTELAAAAPGAASVQPAPAAAGEIRLATPAGVGRGLRDDDVSGLYLALAAAGLVMFLAARRLSVPAVAGGAAAPPASVLKLPNR